jgi:hypothetical protein
MRGFSLLPPAREGDLKRSRQRRDLRLKWSVWLHPKYSQMNEKPERVASSASWVSSYYLTLKVFLDGEKPT